ncbi:hypothetical protein V1634_29765 [Plantactinospora veratri]|uniref:Uncharacterized protein n=1 Tax=Plantactinospora veratri TaxID=1436122 RepID=A0ABU7SM47_9ACTN
MTAPSLKRLDGGIATIEALIKKIEDGLIALDERERALGRITQSAADQNIRSKYGHLLK